MEDPVRKWLYNDSIKLLVTILLAFISYYFVKIDKKIEFVVDQIQEISVHSQVQKQKLLHLEEKVEKIENWIESQ